MPSGQTQRDLTAGAGGLGTLGAVAAGQADDPQRGAVALLGVRPGFQDPGDQRGGGRPGLGSPFGDPRRGPLGVAPVGLGHVRRVGGVPVPDVRAGMGGNPPRVAEDLHSRR